MAKQTSTITEEQFRQFEHFALNKRAKMLHLQHINTEETNVCSYYIAHNATPNVRVIYTFICDMEYGEESYVQSPRNVDIAAVTIFPNKKDGIKKPYILLFGHNTVLANYHAEKHLQDNSTAVVSTYYFEQQIIKSIMEAAAKKFLQKNSKTLLTGKQYQPTRAEILDEVFAKPKHEAKEPNRTLNTVVKDEIKSMTVLKQPAILRAEAVISILQKYGSFRAYCDKALEINRKNILRRIKTFQIAELVHINQGNMPEYKITRQCYAIGMVAATYNANYYKNNPMHQKARVKITEIKNGTACESKIHPFNIVEMAIQNAAQCNRILSIKTLTGEILYEKQV